MTGSSRKSSLFTRLLISLLLIVVVTVFVIIASLTVGGTFDELQENALDRLDERTQNKHQALQTEMIHHWSNLDEALKSVSRTITTRLAGEDASPADMKTNAALNAQIMLDIAPTLVSQLRTGGTTGVFVILNGIGVADKPDTWSGVYLRDSDPSNNTVTNSDILLLRGMPPVSRKLEISLDSFWQAAFQFSDTNRDFFFKPLEAVQSGDASDPSRYGYWCMPFLADPVNPIATLTYTLPICSSSGEVLGVLGVDLMANYVVSELNAGEFIRKEPASYVLGLMEGDTLHVAIAAGANYKQYFNQEDQTIAIQKRLDSSSVTLTGTRNGKLMYGSVQELEVYDGNSPFIGDQWVLVGMMPEDTLMTFSNEFRHTIIAASAVALLCCVFITIFTTRQLSRPIAKLAHQVRHADPTEDLELSHTNITEIDTLADAIESMNHKAIEAVSRLDTIMQVTDMRVGVFESPKQGDTVYCSPSFIDLLDCEDLSIENDRIRKDDFRRIMYDRFTDLVEENVWRVTVRGDERYMRYRQIDSGDRFVGTLMDVTDEIEERQRLERARDYDALTGILNRRAFSRMTQDLFGRHRDEMGVAALVMVDLDNLKFLNTTYGHDTGDSFIRAFAHALDAFAQEDHAIVARRSGDEFYVLLYGYASRDELEEHVHTAWQQVGSQGIVLPDGSFYRFRASGGMTWYPDDSDSFSRLLHYADFAMYTAKRDSKGELAVFDRTVFDEEAYLIDARAALDKMIDSQLMHFAYQPIVSVKTADLWGYELLMRPDVPELKSPLTVLRLAKEQGKLHHIERITWFCGMESISKMQERGLLSHDVKLFINSIASQKMDMTERQHIIDHYSSILPQVVLEVTESEDNNMDYTQRKMLFIRSNGGEVALDDYGTGYNSELALVNIPCEYVKVDAYFVRGIDKAQDKQVMVKNLISYARAKNIGVLAEGVETREEMKTLIDFGVDYLQGFYLGMPREKPQQILQSIRVEIKQMSGQKLA